MGKLKKLLILFLPFLLIFLGATRDIKALPQESPLQAAGRTSPQVKQIEDYMAQQMKSGRIPGAVVVIVKGNPPTEGVYLKSFGFNRLNPRERLTPDLLFPLGSNSESFTALGILSLARERRLRLTDPVSRHLPWFRLDGHEQRVGQITIEHLLYHTSGIPVLPDEAPFSKTETPEELLRKRVSGIRPRQAPGEKYLYSPVNYVLLELIIEKVTGNTYENYLQEVVLTPFNLKHTQPAANLQNINNLAAGHKIEFLRPRSYVVPGKVDGITPGEWVTDAYDLGNWLMANLQGQDPMLEDAQRPDFYVKDQAGCFAAMGWKASQNRKNWLFNQSALPNYASFIAFNSRESLGIAVLTNINADTQFIGWGIIDILHHQKPGAAAPAGVYQKLDSMAVIAIWVMAIFTLVTLVFFGFFLKSVFRKECRFTGFQPKMAVGFILSLLYLGGIALCLRQLPFLLFGGASWPQIQVWISSSVGVALSLATGAVLLFYLYYILNRLFPKPGGKNIFPTVVLSIISGFGNALIIFAINQAFNVDNSMKISLFLFFLMGMVTYVYGQRLVRTHLIKVTANLVYTKRMDIIQKILKSHFHKLESIENGRILAVLNNDTETISGFINTAITGITGLITLSCGLLYLGMVNFYGLLVALAVGFVAAACYFMASRAANKIWQKTRDLQNVFFKFIQDLLSGFKELSLNFSKQKEFHQDLEASSANYRDNRIRFDFTFANMFVVGELMFTVVVGVIAFLFPLIFPGINSDSTRTYVFVFFYLVGPVHGILNMIPNLLQARTSWDRIQQLIRDISALEPVTARQETLELPEPSAWSFALELKEITYRYKNESGESFKVGPVNCRFQSGEITFITGGNGSGKSTLAKLITGLYHPDTGEILVNGKRILPEQLSRYYAAIFSDFHLFGKLYGIDYRAKDQEIQQYLKLMEIAHKLEITDGSFSTVKLSSGQRKRLALMISFLEDRPVYLFDEWAADQDPEFRGYFYHTLLPGLKERGKCIIAITHDDRYFETADQLIKMDLGMIVEQRYNLPVMDGPGKGKALK